MSLIASSEMIVVIGLGVTGLSTARYLQKNNRRFMVMDSRTNPPNVEQFTDEFPEITLLVGKLDEILLSRASEIVISPGMSVKTPELQSAIAGDVPVVGDIELFARAVTKPVIAITGSNAKSTVTQLVGEMAAEAGLRVAIGGNIGTPVLQLLDDKNIDIYVLELSSFQLETTHSLQTVAATVLNISHDHMDRYETLADYHRAKLRVYHGTKNIVVNRQDVLTQPPIAKNADVWSFGDNEPDRKSFGILHRNNEPQLAYQFTPLLPVSEMQIKGKHNAVNALAALALGNAAGFPMDAMLSAIKAFTGLPHRCEWVSTIDQVHYINDSKGTNVGATIAALEGFGSTEKNIVLIAGGDGKSADFSPLVDVVARYVHCAILIGQDAPVLYGLLSASVNCYRVCTLDDAVNLAQKTAQENDTILFSPACASFDMFTGFEDRGTQFVNAVRSLKGAAA